MDAKNIKCFDLRETFDFKLYDDVLMASKNIQACIDASGAMKLSDRIKVINKSLDILRVHHAIIESMYHKIMGRIGGIFSNDKLAMDLLHLHILLNEIDKTEGWDK